MKRYGDAGCGGIRGDEEGERMDQKVGVVKTREKWGRGVREDALSISTPYAHERPQKYMTDDTKKK